MLNGKRSIFNNRFAGGWLDQRYHLMSWAYSCLQLRRFYKDVELVTDAQGKALLVDQLQLPYTRVDAVLNQLDHYNPELWVLGKIHAYSLQDTPFIHVDGDVFIWKKFDERLERGELIAQNAEVDFPIYEEESDWLLEHGFILPQVLRDAREKGLSFDAYNAGIMGGNNIGFLKDYVRTFMEFVTVNRDLLGTISSGLVNAFCEQHLYYAMARQQGIRVQCYTDSIDRDELDRTLKGMRMFREAPGNCGFIHLFGEDTKKEPAICEEIERRLRSEYPEVHERVGEVVSAAAIAF